MELEKLRACGVTLSFKPDMDVPLWQLRHEFDQHSVIQELMQRVGMAKTVLKLLVYIIQTACASFLKLEGWSAYVNEQLDSGLYDMALENIYRSVMGKGRPNPWMQIGMLVLGGAIVYQLDNMAKESASNPGGSSNSILKMLGMASNIMSIIGGGNKPKGSMTSPPGPGQVGGAAPAAAAAAAAAAATAPPAASSSAVASAPTPAAVSDPGAASGSTAGPVPGRRTIRRLNT